jgi:hypothetical protein
MTSVKETTAALSETVLAAKGAVQDIRRSATNMMDQARTDTAETLHSAASTVRAAGNQGSAAIEDFAEGTGQRLDATSAYIGKNDASDMAHDLRRIVRRHPGAFLLLTASVAACIGYVSGSKFGNYRD